MSLSNAQLRWLRGEAHHLNPVIMVGANGVTEALLEELDSALEHHELLKVKVRAEDREDKNFIIEELVKRSGAIKVHTIGHVLVLYRAAKKPKLVIPKSL